MQDGRTVRRIAARLFALALLAEHAAGRSFPVRFIVLAILLRAEAVACAFVAETTGADWPGPGAPRAFSGSAADAEFLAVRLRLLAAMLATLSRAGFRSGGAAAGCVNPATGAAVLPVLLLVRSSAAHGRSPPRPPRPPQAHDTS